MLRSLEEVNVRLSAIMFDSYCAFPQNILCLMFLNLKGKLTSGDEEDLE